MKKEQAGALMNEGIMDTESLLKEVREKLHDMSQPLTVLFNEIDIVECEMLKGDCPTLEFFKEIKTYLKGVSKVKEEIQIMIRNAMEPKEEESIINWNGIKMNWKAVPKSDNKFSNFTKGNLYYYLLRKEKIPCVVIITSNIKGVTIFDVKRYLDTNWERLVNEAEKVDQG